jgi:hypothetical protein
MLLYVKVKVMVVSEFIGMSVKLASAENCFLVL